LFITWIKNFIEIKPTIAETRIPITYDIKGIEYIWARVSSSEVTISKMDAPRIAGIDRRNEYFTKLGIVNFLNIPMDKVAPLLETLEKIDRPWPTPIKSASTFLSSLFPCFRNFVKRTNIPVTTKPAAMAVAS
jgi:hypothetical protein